MIDKVAMDNIVEEYSEFTIKTMQFTKEERLVLFNKYLQRKKNQAKKQGITKNSDGEVLED